MDSDPLKKLSWNSPLAWTRKLSLDEIGILSCISHLSDPSLLKEFCIALPVFEITNGSASSVLTPKVKLRRFQRRADPGSNRHVCSLRSSDRDIYHMSNQYSPPLRTRDKSTSTRKRTASTWDLHKTFANNPISYDKVHSMMYLLRLLSVQLHAYRLPSKNHPSSSTDAYSRIWCT